jgi:hypothetical protein
MTASAGAWAGLCSATLAALASSASAQAAPAAVERWLASDQVSRPLLDEAVQALLVDPQAGFAWLGGKLAGAKTEQAVDKGVESLVVHCTLEFVRRQRKSGMHFEGQYAPLRAVQPMAGEFLFGLLLDTPDWFPHTHRVHLVRPLRDLQPAPPAEPRLQRVMALAADAAREPEDLRRALAAMLWSWGHKEPAKEHLTGLLLQSADGDPADRVRALGELAAFQYELLDYRSAAATHRSLAALATSSGIALKPIDLYSAACVHALVGDVERGIAALQRCALLLASPDVDSSHKLARELFDNDPELAPLRRDPRWRGIVEQAFGGGTGR